ncbi:hypothetical protein AX14_008134, partial [Amanita brunnescens Koide BX004]
AIKEAVQWACVNRLSNPVFLIDNKATLGLFLDTRVRHSQMALIRINEILRDWLSSDSDATVADWGKYRRNEVTLLGFLDKNPTAFTFMDTPLDVH